MKGRCVKGMRRKICVLMTSYNPKEYIIEQVKSILNQKNVEIEVIIRDDASTDKSYLRKLLGEKRVTIIEGKCNLGVAGNIKELLKYAYKNRQDYEYFAYSDQDDVWFEDKIIVAIEKLESLDENKCCLYYSNLLVTDKNLNPSHELFKRNVVKNSLGQSLAQVFLFACTSVFNYKMIESIIGYDFEEIGFDSLIYYLGIIKGEVIYDDNPHIYYRQHGENVSGQKEKGFIYFTNKIRYILDNSKNHAMMKRNANYLLENMKEDLCADDISLVRKVADYNSLGSRIAIIFDNRIQSGYFPKNFYCWARLLLSKY